MRLIKFKGREIKITEADRNKMLKRWDVDKAEETEEKTVGGKDFTIQAECHFCVKCSDCRDCLLDHCSDMIGAILTKRQGAALFIQIRTIWWLKKDNAVARRGIQRIRKAILDLPRV